MTPLCVYMVLLRGLERLMLADVLTENDVDNLVKVSIDRYVREIFIIPLWGGGGCLFVPKYTFFLANFFSKHQFLTQADRYVHLT